MDTVDKGNLLFCKFLGHRLIGTQHEILNQLCRAVCLMDLNVCRNPFFIQQDLCLREIKINCPAGCPQRPDFLRQFQHLTEHRDIAFVFFQKCRIPVLKNRLHIRIAHPSADTDHRFADSVVGDPAFFIKRHDAGKGQAVFPGIQGADAVGQLFRKHRDDAVSQINRSPSFQRFPVKRGMILDVIGNVRDVDAEDVIFSVFRKGNSIVQILGIRPVNGNGLPFAKVFPSGEVAGKELIRNAVSLLQDFFRKLHRDVCSACY